MITLARAEFGRLRDSGRQISESPDINGKLSLSVRILRGSSPIFTIYITNS